MHHFNRIASKDLVIGLPKLKFKRDKICEACQKGKKTKSSFKQKKMLFQLQGLLNCFTWIYLDPLGP